MRLPGIFCKTLRDLKWQVFWYGMGLGLLAALVVYIYPSYKDQLADFDIPDAMRALIGDVDFSSGSGFLSAEFLSWAPVLVVVFAIMAGVSAIAGEEANGTLDLLLARPISRTRVALEKVAGLVVAVFGIAAICYIGWLVSVPFVEIDVSLWRLFIATFNMVPLMLFFVALSMWAGVTLPDRRAASGFATAVAVASFFTNFVANLVASLETLQYVSVFYYYDVDALAGGLDPAKLAVMLGLALAFFMLMLGSFQNREVGVGGHGLSLPRLSLRRDQGPGGETSR